MLFGWVARKAVLSVFRSGAAATKAKAVAAVRALSLRFFGTDTKRKVGDRCRVG
jgi:hypothetical protein